MKKILIKNKSAGQSLMEYMILTALVGLLCLTTVKSFGEVIKQRIDHIKSKLVEVIRI